MGNVKESLVLLQVFNMLQAIVASIVSNRATNGGGRQPTQPLACCPAPSLEPRS